MPPIAQFKSHLEASSYHAPGGGSAYAPLRASAVAQATAMGYDAATMSEHGVVWADDQDPFGHIKNHGFSHFVSVANFRLFESFEAQLGDKYEDLLKARGIGIMSKSLTVELKRPVSYPDSLLVAVRIKDVKPDRYYVTTSIWSLRQQAIVAESSGWVVFFDYRVGKPVSLIDAGGVYADLYSALSAKAADSKVLAEKWEKEHPPKKKPAKL